MIRANGMCDDAWFGHDAFSLLLGVETIIRMNVVMIVATIAATTGIFRNNDTAVILPR